MESYEEGISDDSDDDSIGDAIMSNGFRFREFPMEESKSEKGLIHFEVLTTEQALEIMNECIMEVKRVIQVSDIKANLFVLV